MAQLGLAALGALPEGPQGDRRTAKVRKARRFSSPRTSPWPLVDRLADLQEEPPEHQDQVKVNQPPLLWIFGGSVVVQRAPGETPERHLKHPLAAPKHPWRLQGRSPVFLHMLYNRWTYQKKSQLYRADPFYTISPVPDVSKQWGQLFLSHLCLLQNVSKQGEQLLTL